MKLNKTMSFTLLLEEFPDHFQQEIFILYPRIFFHMKESSFFLTILVSIICIYTSIISILYTSCQPVDSLLMQSTDAFMTISNKRRNHTRRAQIIPLQKGSFLWNADMLFFLHIAALVQDSFVSCVWPYYIDYNLYMILIGVSQIQNQRNLILLITLIFCQIQFSCSLNMLQNNKKRLGILTVSTSRKIGIEWLSQFLS